MSFTHTSVPLLVKPNLHTIKQKKCAKFRNPHMGAHTHTGPKHRMQQCKGKRAPSVILQQMMSNKSDDSITTNSQYETQVPWLLLNLLATAALRIQIAKSPWSFWGFINSFNSFLATFYACARTSTHTHIHFHCPQTTANSQ
jgi:hypothetical protein